MFVKLHDCPTNVPLSEVVCDSYDLELQILELVKPLIPPSAWSVSIDLKIIASVPSFSELADQAVEAEKRRREAT